jgi:hypothetical protein
MPEGRRLSRRCHIGSSQFCSSARRRAEPVIQSPVGGSGKAAWRGVTCAGGRVTRLVLEALGLFGADALRPPGARPAPWAQAALPACCCLPTGYRAMADDGNIVVAKRLSDAVPALLASPAHRGSDSRFDALVTRPMDRGFSPGSWRKPRLKGTL